MSRPLADGNLLGRLGALAVLACVFWGARRLLLCPLPSSGGASCCASSSR